MRLGLFKSSSCIHLQVDPPITYLDCWSTFLHLAHECNQVRPGSNAHHGPFECFLALASTVFPFCQVLIDFSRAFVLLMLVFN